MKKLKIAFDIDDTLVEFSQSILDIVNKKYGKNYQMSNVTWDFGLFTDEERVFAHSLFRDPDFISDLRASVPVVELVRGIAERGHEVFFITATYHNVMSARSTALVEDFPFVHPKNIIITGRKDLCNFDILFDDKPDNLITSIAKIPVAVNRPWNHNMIGYPRIHNIQEAKKIVEMAEKGMTRHQIMDELPNQKTSKEKPCVVLVGGSGSGKTFISSYFDPSKYEKVVTCTTRKPRNGEVNGTHYHFLTCEEFEEKLNNNGFFESTVINGNYYGLPKDEIARIRENGKIPLMILDIHGAKAVEKETPAAIFYLARDKKKMMEEILSRQTDSEDIFNRLIGIAGENVSHRCHFFVENNSEPEKVVQKIEKCLQ